MTNKQDWDTIINSSEIFNNYVELTLQKDAESERERIRKATQQIEDDIDTLESVLDGFDKLEQKIASNPKLVKKLKQAKQALLTNPELIENTDPDFVNGIMMLNLPSEEIELEVVEE